MALNIRLLRVQRSAKSIAGGDEILKFLLIGPNRRKLVEAAESGRPPVTAITSALMIMAKEKNIDLKALPVRQFIGSVVRAILDKEGYTLAEKGIRTPKDPVFTTASLYVQKKKAVSGNNKLLQKFIECLSDEEALFAYEELKSRLDK